MLTCLYSSEGGEQRTGMAGEYLGWNWGAHSLAYEGEDAVKNTEQNAATSQTYIVLDPQR